MVIWCFVFRFFVFSDFNFFTFFFTFFFFLFTISGGGGSNTGTTRRSTTSSKTTEGSIAALHEKLRALTFPAHWDVPMTYSLLGEPLTCTLYAVNNCTGITAVIGRVQIPIFQHQQQQQQQQQQQVILRFLLFLTCFLHILTYCD